MQCRIKFSLENAKNIDKKEDSLTSVDFTLYGEHTNHPKENTIQIDKGKIKTEKELTELAKHLIKQNLQNPLSFHIQNLETNKIKLSLNKIKNILQNLREEKYPKVDIFLHIEFIKIDLGESEEFQNINFCPGREKFINFKTKKLKK